MSAPTAETTRRATLSMAAATVFFFAMSVAVREAEGIPTLQIVFFRAIVALAICLVQLRLAGIPPLGTHRRLLLQRGALGTMALVCFFSSLARLPLATATVLQNLAPVFTVAIAAALLGERLTRLQLALFALAGVGVWMVEGAEVTGDTVGVLIALGGAGFAAGAYSTIAAIGDREHPLVIVLWFPLVTVPIVSPMLPAIWVWPNPHQWGALITVGVVVQVAQVLMTKAYQLGPTSVVSLVSYLSVAWAGLGGWLLYRETLTGRAALGLVWILVAVVVTTRTRAT